MKHAKTLNQDEIDQFNALAAEWWDMEGPMAPLHRMNPVRLDYITAQIRAHHSKIKGLRILDVGCGGGIVSEPLARLGAQVTGIDGAENLIAIAKQHAVEQELEIEYLYCLTRDLIAQKETFDVVLGLEIIEHVPEQRAFMAELSALTKKNGMAITSTLNRTPSSWALGIIAAEHILRWLPVGTHDWKKFVKPSEMAAWATDAGLTPHDMTGVIYNPLQKTFALHARRLDVNYIFSAVKK